MKILMVVASYSPSFGGPTTVIKALSRELAKRGHEVSIYTSDNFDKSSRVQESGKTIEIDGVKASYFKNIGNKLAYNHNIYVSPMLLKEARNNLKKFDIIHFHGFRTFQSIIIHHYAKKYNIPYILQPRGTIPRFEIKRNLKTLFDLFFGYKILKDASKLIFTTKMELKYCEDDFDINGNKIAIVPNGINLSEYANLPKRGEFRKKYSINADEKIILYLGRIHEIKGLDLLVRAFADLTKELDNVRLVIVGPDDGYTSTLKEIVVGLKIDDKVLFTGPHFERDKLKAYVDADVFVLPSKYESFGNVALEACACGTPVIVTDRCGIAEWINNDVGYVVKYDKKELRDALFKVLSDEGLRRRFGDGGRKLVMEEFSWNNIVRKMEEIYEDCVE